MIAETFTLAVLAAIISQSEQRSSTRSQGGAVKAKQPKIEPEI